MLQSCTALAVSQAEPNSQYRVLRCAVTRTRRARARARAVYLAGTGVRRAVLGFRGGGTNGHFKRKTKTRDKTENTFENTHATEDSYPKTV